VLAARSARDRTASGDERRHGCQGGGKSRVAIDGHHDTLARFLACSSHSSWGGSAASCVVSAIRLTPLVEAQICEVVTSWFWLRGGTSTRSYALTQYDPLTNACSRARRLLFE